MTQTPPPPFHFPGVTASTFAQALSALEMLTRLCVESGWRWIDGMLLAGCLAYGLGNFNDALGWYSRILEVDSKSVTFPSPLFPPPPPPTRRGGEGHHDDYLRLRRSGLTNGHFQSRGGHLEFSGDAAFSEPS